MLNHKFVAVMGGNEGDQNDLLHLYFLGQLWQNEYILTKQKKVRHLEISFLLAITTLSRQAQPQVKTTH